MAAQEAVMGEVGTEKEGSAEEAMEEGKLVEERWATEWEKEAR